MDFQSIWFRYGVIYGLTSIMISLISFYVYPIGIWTQMLIGFLLMIVFFVIVCKEEKKLNDGILPYGSAFKLSFLTGFTGMVLAGIFAIILFQLVDPSLLDVVREQSLESTRSMMEKMGAPEETIADAIEKAEENMESSFTIGSQLLNILTSSLFVLIIAAIVSLFTKKEPSVA